MSLQATRGETAEKQRFDGRMDFGKASALVKGTRYSGRPMYTVNPFTLVEATD
jgi:hypothetical protein